MVNSAKQEAAYQSGLSSPNLALQQEIPLKLISANTDSPGRGSTQHLRFAEMSDNSHFLIDDESEHGKITMP